MHPDSPAETECKNTPINQYRGISIHSSCYPTETTNTFGKYKCNKPGTSSSMAYQLLEINCWQSSCTPHEQTLALFCFFFPPEVYQIPFWILNFALYYTLQQFNCGIYYFKEGKEKKRCNPQKLQNTAVLLRNSIPKPYLLYWKGLPNLFYFSYEFKCLTYTYYLIFTIWFANLIVLNHLSFFT